MRIAFCMINCNRRDGSARAVNEVMERLARKHEIHLFARKAEDLDLEILQWHRVPGPCWPEVADFWTYHHSVNSHLKRASVSGPSVLNSPLSTRSYDIIHSIGCNAPSANVITIQNIEPAKRKSVLESGEINRVSLARRVTRALYLRVTAKAEHRLYTKRESRCPPLFLPVSKGTEAELRSHYDIGSAPVRVIPNAADTNVFHPIPEAARRAWREQNGVGTGAVMLIFSGGEWARKGLDDAIRALAKLEARDVQLFVAGDDPDRSRYFRLATALGIANRVIFGGFRGDIATALASADVFLFPSWYEAFSLATLEAAACGLPIVATKINGTEDFIISGETGEFIEHAAENIVSVLRPLILSPETRRKMGENARRSVELNYTWDRVAKMTGEAYEDYLDNETQFPANSHSIPAS